MDALPKDFSLEINGNALRWSNWQQFIDSSLCRPMRHGFVVAVVTHNRAKETKALLHYLQTQNSIFDILIVDDHSSTDQWKILKDLWDSEPRLSLIRTKCGLGGSGAYACSVEYALHRGYEQILITEDDALPLQPHIVDKILEKSAAKSVVRIVHQENHSPSFTFHFSLYPAALLKVVGAPDPRFFMRFDDHEWGLKILEQIAKKDFELVILSDVFYFHPVFSSHWSAWNHYLFLRNGLYTYARNSNLSSWLKHLLIHLPADLSMLLIDGSQVRIVASYLALRDFLFGQLTHAMNQERRSYLTALAPPSPVFQPMDAKEALGQNSPKNIADLLRICSARENLFRLFGKYMIGTSYFSDLHPLWFLKKDVFFIDAFVETSGSLKVSLWKNEKHAGWLLAFISILIGLALMPVIAVFCLPQYFALKKMRLKNEP